MAVSRLSSLQNAFLSLGVLIFVLVILYFGQSILVPLCLAILLAFVLSPLVAWLESCGLKRVYASLLSVLLAVAILGGIFSIVVSEARNLAPRAGSEQAPQRTASRP